MGRPLSGTGPLEGGVTDFLEAHFRRLRVDFERQPIAPGRDNIVARYDPTGDGPRRTLLWDAHQDTVPTDGMTIPPFDPRIDGDRLYGRGSCDVKGGLASMLHAFSRLVAERPAGSATVLMACTVDEEFTHIGLVAPGRLADLRGPPCRPRHRRRADPARRGHVPQGGRALEGPDEGPRLPQFDSRSGRQCDLSHGAGGRGACPSMRPLWPGGRPIRCSARRVSPSAGSRAGSV